MTTITDWKKLDLGQHIKLNCGCEGFVIELRTEAHDDECPEANTGFVLAYTDANCGGRPWSHEKAYREGYGPYSNFFNYDMKTSYLPAEIVEPPAWWPEVATLLGWPLVLKEYPCRPA